MLLQNTEIWEFEERDHCEKTSSVEWDTDQRIREAGH